MQLKASRHLHLVKCLAKIYRLSPTRSDNCLEFYRLLRETALLTALLLTVRFTKAFATARFTILRLAARFTTARFATLLLATRLTADRLAARFTTARFTTLRLAALLRFAIMDL